MKRWVVSMSHVDNKKDFTLLVQTRKMPGPTDVSSSVLPVSRKEDALCQEAVIIFTKQFGSTPQVVACGPGRVNLIGEHTDYQMGFVFPMAIDLKTVVCASLRETKTIRIHSTEKETVEWSADEFPKSPPDAPEWWCYVVGAIRIYCDIAGLAVPRGLDVAICTNVPIGGGLSSSAALEVATWTAMEFLLKKTLTPMQKAEGCQRAEHDWAKVPCGLMDQAISVMGVEDSAMLFDCKNKIPSYHTLSQDEVRILVVDSGVRHKLVDGQYAARKAKCAEAVKTLQASNPEIESLRDCDMETLEKAKGMMDGEAYQRATHVILECKRCLEFADRLSAKDWKAAGALMYEGHKSLSEIYETSVAQTDKLVEIAKGVRGVYGARMTGGGFGGCVVMMVKKDEMETAAAEVMTKYNSYFKEFRPVNGSKLATCDPTSFYACSSRGAHIWQAV